MSRRIVSTNIRFNLEKEADRTAWEYLQQRDKKQHRSYSRAVIAAVNDYFERRGRLAADPELRTTQTGKQVASFRMAVDRDMVDANGHRPTDWLTFTAWGKTAEFVSRYFRKGSAAVVHSRCQTRQYEDKNGNNRTAIEFVVDNIYFAGPKQDNQQGTVDDGGTNPPPATYRNQQPQPQQMGFATQSQRQQWQGAADHPGNVQVSQSFSQGSDDDFSVLDDADDLPF